MEGKGRDRRTGRRRNPALKHCIVEKKIRGFVDIEKNAWNHDLEGTVPHPSVTASATPNTGGAETFAERTQGSSTQIQTANQQKNEQHNQSWLWLVFLSSPTLYLPIGQANSAGGEVLVQSHSSPLGPVWRSLYTFRC
jgi:hypothetical protein